MELEGKVVSGLAVVQGDQVVKLDKYGGVHVSQTVPDRVALARANRIYGGNAFAGTAKAPVATLPTTSPEWAIYNGEPDGGKSFLMLAAGVTLISGTPDIYVAIVGAVTLARQTTVPSLYASAIVESLSGGSKATKGVLANNPTLTGGTPAWVLLKVAYGAAGAVVGFGVTDDDLEKKGFLVPPGGMFCLEVFASAGTTALYSPSFVWAEVD